MATFLDGCAAMACLAIGLFFLRFWRESEDRLFIWLATAFCVFAVNYAVLGLLPLADERRAYALMLRLIGFIAILIGVMVKERELTEHPSTVKRQWL